jgi:3-dehydroquinate dehydratase-2
MGRSKKNMPRVLVIHGPNLNMLGLREPEVYGRTRLAEIDDRLVGLGRQWNIEMSSFQSNHEGAIVEKIQASLGKIDGLIINPAAYTHTSIAIRDAIVVLGVPIIEVHLSNIHKREAFRHKSLMADVVTGQIVGLGVTGYYLALQALAEKLGMLPSD